MRTSTKGILATLIIASTLTLGACQGQKQTKAEAEQQYDDWCNMSATYCAGWAVLVDGSEGSWT